MAPGATWQLNMQHHTSKGQPVLSSITHALFDTQQHNSWEMTVIITPRWSQQVQFIKLKMHAS